MLPVTFPGNLAAVPSLAALRSLSSFDLSNQQNMLVQGGDAPGDGGGGAYVWSASSTESDDGLRVIRPTNLTPGQAGRWTFIGALSGSQGKPGAANNTYDTVSAIADPTGNPTTNGSAILIQAGLQTVYNWQLGDFTDPKYRVNIDVIQSGAVPLSTGAWVKQDFKSGLRGDAVTDDTAALSTALVAPTRLPKATYMLSSNQPLAVDKLTVDPAAVVRSPNLPQIAYNDPSGSLIGIGHNYLEQALVTSGVNPIITTGAITSPPLFDGEVSSDIIHMGHWYNDSGLESTRVANGTKGWPGWWAWQWNYAVQTDPNLTPQDKTRLSLMGYFRGDDPRVLDWQCYWNLRGGVNAVDLNPSAGVDMSTWSTPSDSFYWLYQLFNNAPNFKKQSYVLWLLSEFGKTAAEVNAATSRTLAIMLDGRYSNFLTVKDERGGVYPVLYAFEGEAWRGTFDNYNGSTNTQAYLVGIANSFKAAGYAGVCIMARNGTDNSIMSRTDLEANGVMYVDAGYASITGETGSEADYAAKITSLSAPATRSVINVVTSRTSKKPHPSNYSLPGNTPALFEQMLRKARRLIRANPQLLPIVGIYSIWEWAEGGANLSPTVADGFAYLDASAKAHSDQTAAVSRLQDPFVKIVSGGFGQIPAARVVSMYAGSDTYLGTTFPSIMPGIDGQRILLRNAGPGSVTIPSNEDDSRTKVKFATRPAKFPSGSLVPPEMELEYRAVDGLWHERWRSANMQTVQPSGTTLLATNVTPVTTFDANTADLAGTRQALGTLINAMRAAGVTQ